MGDDSRRCSACMRAISRTVCSRCGGKNTALSAEFASLSLPVVGGFIIVKNLVPGCASRFIIDLQKLHCLNSSCKSVQVYGFPGRSLLGGRPDWDILVPAINSDDGVEL